MGPISWRIEYQSFTNNPSVMSHSEYYMNDGCEPETEQYEDMNRWESANTFTTGKKAPTFWPDVYSHFQRIWTQQQAIHVQLHNFREQVDKKE